MEISSDLISSLGSVVQAQPDYSTLVTVPPVLLPTIEVRQRAQFISNGIGGTYKDSFINDANIAQTNVAGSTTVCVTLEKGLWLMDWSFQTFRNFAGVDGDRFSLALSYDGGTNWIAIARSDKLDAGTETYQRGSLRLLVSSPNLQFIVFVPTSVGVGNRVKAHSFFYGQKLA